ncbi:hypothetical protein HLH33_18590 [Gluconacetobacter diazotrophicus]|uniref:Uncharacterized protein n=1 Tax=Gluconacetobacter diazotrophicus TaxID=33996 RepID=A0A7W4I8J1_GLUDI|nr:hypothetical protein [Gluconacetobacter diazotrophicus]MBB2158274.1 hypothetical protein [Gluconacetobacter diazotrophicus]
MSNSADQDNYVVGYTIFCEDIRHEVGGKDSYIGVHKGILIAKDFPVIIPRLALSINVREPRALTRKRQAPMKIGVYLPGHETPVTEMLVPVPPEGVISNRLDNLDDAEIATFYTVLTSSQNVQIEQPGAIRVRMNYEGSPVKCGALFVQGEQADAAV